MPTYEYECTRCGKITEEFKPVSAPRRQRCPACRSKVTRILSGGSGVLFKGSGFYINDSRPKDAGGDDAKNANTPAESSGAKGTKTDGKKGAGGD